MCFYMIIKLPRQQRGCTETPSFPSSFSFQKLCAETRRSSSPFVMSQRKTKSTTTKSGVCSIPRGNIVSVPVQTSGPSNTEPTSAGNKKQAGGYKRRANLTVMPDNRRRRRHHQMILVCVCVFSVLRLAAAADLSLLRLLSTSTHLNR